MSNYNLKTPRCQHVKDNGIQCGSPALRDQPFCYQHDRTHNCKLRPGDRGYLLPPLESSLSVTIAAVQIAQAAHDGKITLPMARTLLYAVQLAAPYAGRANSPLSSDVTIDLPPAMQQIVQPREQPAISDRQIAAGAPFKPSVGLSGAVSSSAGDSPAVSRATSPANSAPSLPTFAGSSDDQPTAGTEDGRPSVVLNQRLSDNSQSTISNLDRQIPRSSDHQIPPIPPRQARVIADLVRRSSVKGG